MNTTFNPQRLQNGEIRSNEQRANNDETYEIRDLRSKGLQEVKEINSERILY